VREMKIRFIRFLRDVQKFNGVNALKEQLTKDIRRIREDD
jgi:FAD synthase